MQCAEKYLFLDLIRDSNHHSDEKPGSQSPGVDQDATPDTLCIQSLDDVGSPNTRPQFPKGSMGTPTLEVQPRLPPQKIPTAKTLIAAARIPGPKACRRMNIHIRSRQIKGHHQDPHSGSEIASVSGHKELTRHQHNE